MTSLTRLRRIYNAYWTPVSRNSAKCLFNTCSKLMRVLLFFLLFRGVAEIQRGYTTCSRHLATKWLSQSSCPDQLQSLHQELLHHFKAQIRGFFVEEGILKAGNNLSENVNTLKCNYEKVISKNSYDPRKIRFSSHGSLSNHIFI